MSQHQLKPERNHGEGKSGQMKARALGALDGTLRNILLLLSRLTCCWQWQPRVGRAVICPTTARVATIRWRSSKRNGGRAAQLAANQVGQW